MAHPMRTCTGPSKVLKDTSHDQFTTGFTTAVEALNETLRLFGRNVAQSTGHVADLATVTFWRVSRAVKPKTHQNSKIQEHAKSGRNWSPR